jgi:hypothetical protein
MVSNSNTEAAMENTLVVFDLRGNWMVDWQHTPEAARVADLFGGQSSLPTPYSTLVPVSKVIADVAKLNPKYKVVAAGTNGISHYLPEKFSNRAGAFVPAPKVS